MHYLQERIDTARHFNRDISMTAEIRWKQRFENFTRAFNLFDSAVKLQTPSKLEKEGVIQRFEYTFELAWKTLRDYMRYGGIETDLPRDVIKEAFANTLIQDGKVWIDMLEKRNLMAHTYDEASFETAYSKITQEYYKALKQVYDLLLQKSRG